MRSLAEKASEQTETDKKYTYKEDSIAEQQQ
jgi:hypothetical protein